MCAAKTKMPISYAEVTAQLICVFVFAYTDFGFSGAATHLKESEIIL